MIDPSRTVALVGRPNVGKSRLFNRLCGRRLSIVHDQPGVTRDLISAEVDDDYLLLDTGGIGMELEMTPKQIAAASEEQVDFAIGAAAVIVFIVDGRAGLTALDERVAEKLRRHGRPVVLAVNKIDRAEDEGAADEFAGLGLGEALAVSAEHGRGAKALEEAIRKILGPKPPAAAGPREHRIRISLVGRPNVGKSSLGNRLLDSSRLIVSDVPGTTRDSVELDLDYRRPDGDTLKFRLADTAGLRSKRKVDSPVEYFSTVRTQHAIERSDVVLLVVDALDGVTRQDQALAGQIVEAGRALIVAVNKWDLVTDRWRGQPVEGYKSLKHFLQAYEKSLRKELFFLPSPPVLFVSAVTGFRVETLLDSAAAIEATLDMKLPTGHLNRRIGQLFEARPPRRVGAKRFKVFYAVQTGRRPFRVRLFCNRVERLEPTYRRYLEKGLQEAFRLDGCPVRFDLVGKAQRYTEPDEAERELRPALPARKERK
jgi:GTP-binding protein